MIPGLAFWRRPGFVLMIGAFSAALLAPSAGRAQQVWTGGAPIANPMPGTDLNGRLEAMERELRRLGAEAARGPESRPELESAFNRLSREFEAFRADQRRFQADVDRRLRDLEARPGAPRPPTGPTSLGGVVQSQSPSLVPPTPPVMDAPGAFGLDTRSPAFPQIGLAPTPGLSAPILRDEPPSMPLMGFDGLEVTSGPGVRLPGPAPSLRTPTVVVDSAPDLGDLSMAMAPPRVGPAPTAPIAAAIAPGASPQGDYDAALRLLETGGADQALEIFGRIAANAPNDPVAGSAQYWIGDIHFRKAEYDLAARAFLDSFRRWPEGPKGAESLLRLGMTLAATGKRTEACAAFAQVQSRYPGAAPDVLGRARIETQRNQCS